MSTIKGINPKTHKLKFQPLNARQLLQDNECEPKDFVAMDGGISRATAHYLLTKYNFQGAMEKVALLCQVLGVTAEHLLGQSIVDLNGKTEESKAISRTVGTTINLLTDGSVVNFRINGNEVGQQAYTPEYMGYAEMMGVGMDERYDPHAWNSDYVPVELLAEEQPNF